MQTTNDVVKDNGCTCLRLRKASRIASRLYDKHLAEAGLNVGQYGILLHVGQMVEACISDLAAELEMERTTLTRNLAPLERSGFVAIGKGIDRRSKSVTLTREGRDTLAGARPLWKKAQNEIDQALGATTKKKLHDELDRSIGRLRAASS